MDKGVCKMIKSGKKKYSFEYIKNFIESKGCILLETKEDIGALEKIKILCSCKNEFFITSFNGFINGKINCDKCCNEKRKSKIEDVINIIKKSKYQYVSGKYFKSSINSLIVKDNFEYYYKISLSIIQHSIKKNGSLLYVSVSNPFSFENIKKWIKLNNRKFELVSGKFKNSYEKTLKLKCNICNEKWITSWRNISRKRGCPFCASIKVGKKNNFGIIFPELLTEWDFKKNIINPYKIMPYSTKRIFWICEKCKNCWDTKLYSRTFSSNGSNCPKCSSSKGEIQVEKFLNKNNFSYLREYKFENCKYKKPLQFDFYIPNIKTALEYQGEQHFKIVSFGEKDKQKSKKLFDQLLIRDDIKREYCVNNNIRLLEIPYWEINNVDSILTKEILEYANVS